MKVIGTDEVPANTLPSGICTVLEAGIQTNGLKHHLFELAVLTRTKVTTASEQFEVGACNETTVPLKIYSGGFVFACELRLRDATQQGNGELKNLHDALTRAFPPLSGHRPVKRVNGDKGASVAVKGTEDLDLNALGVIGSALSEFLTTVQEFLDLTKKLAEVTAEAERLETEARKKRGEEGSLKSNIAIAKKKLPAPDILEQIYELLETP